ncbi:MAG: efflux RND transporter permease subunit, partial [Desulfurivibrionaceae bacterium]
MRITEYAVRRRLASVAIALALAVLGAYGLWGLSVDYLPDVNYALVKVQIPWPGATPEEIDKEIADPVERLMATVDHLDYLESTSREGLYSLDVQFEYGSNIDVAFQDVMAILTRAGKDLPSDLEPPFVFKARPSQLPVIQVTVSSDRWGPVEVREWANNWLQDRLVAVPGVAGTEIIGGLEREIRVLLDPAALEKHRLSLDTVLKRLAAENVERTGGRMSEGRREIIARTMGELTTLDEIGAVLLARQGQAGIYLRDIAQIVDSHEDIRLITRYNGEPCVKISVLGQAEANTVEVARGVADKILELRPELPAGVRLDYVENQAEYVENALAGVWNAALGAVVLLIAVIYLFLGSIRQVLVMLIALPLTLLFNFGLMKLAGFSLNTFSLAGLVVAIGVLLDNSIVVIEGISRHRLDKPEESAADQAVAATREVGPAIVAATLSFLALFVPFLIVPGLTSLLFRELILVVAGIVVISLLMAITVTPMLTAAFFSGHRRGRGPTRFERAFDRFADGYGWFLGWVLRGRWLTLALFLAVFLLALWLAGRLGGEFLPAVDDGRIMIKAKLATGAAVRETDLVLADIEARLAGDPLIKSMFTMAGGRVQGLYTYEIANEGEVDIQLVPKGERQVSTKAYVAKLRHRLSQVEVPGGLVMVRQMPIKGIHGLGGSDLVVEVRGQEVAPLFDLAQQVAQTIRAGGEMRNVYVSMDVSRPEYQVRIDRAKAAELEVSAADVAGTLRSLITGAVASRYRDGAEYYNIRVVVPEDRLSSRRDLEHLILTGVRGEPLRLRDLATIQPALGPVEILRKDQVKQITIEGDTAGRDLATTLTGLRRDLAKIELPAGYELGFGGRAEMMADMKKALLAVITFALFFSFVVLTVQFDSVKLPALVLGSVPFCLAGMVYLLHLTGLPFAATVIIGVLVVMAATVSDGVLLLTFAGELRES